MKEYQRECPYCGDLLANSYVVLKEDGSVVDARNDVYWCTAKNCCGKLGITRVFKENEDGFLVECGVEDIDPRASYDMDEDEDDYLDYSNEDEEDDELF